MVKKHEQVILVLLAYVIGFTTAFIAFGISDGKMSGYEKREKYQASLVSKVSAKQEVEVLEKSDGLYVLNDGKERIISAVSEDISGPGYHTAIVRASVSPNNLYVHYCAEEEMGAGECSHYVYSVAKDTIYRVKDENGAFVSDNTAATATVWGSDNTLQLEGSIVVSAASSWSTR